MTSTPTLVNSETDAGIYTISEINIGGLVQHDILPVQDLEIKPGVKYTLTLRVLPKDVYLTFNSLPAVAIDGNIWMKHNLGADTSIDPVTAPMSEALHGNYYQWGRDVVIGTGTTRTPFDWDGSHNPDRYAWNTGRLGAPSEKTATDPCPAGYRVPSREEARELMANSISSTVGDRTASPTNYEGATLLTSKRNGNVHMVIPAQGRFLALGTRYPFSLSDIELRGNVASFWTNYLDYNGFSGITIFTGVANGTVNVSAMGLPGHKTMGYPVRCIAE
ncbi:FISUMP domain-containing protein [Sphingobacterium kitahiroshimense]|uniref:FISUMP domain-containing protein n=1 Tax=Sphingobacterium kitahiroshimense TaxID=470446 RepID=UPI0032087D27